ncbi:hypothetical protein IU433_27865 [Nocardia puris]|uniref:Ligand-binding SRPBCC domain-containing protein n=1 Tax=Nocardia puris TaxID=208602 RepID=A0A366E339_9NOCA|nr:hypothetical protein [Nocardia puris]MBF6214409.1 hypothetical protein [Nocardia puris]MBF6369024.1 hypothetical protein [Nocardia puris]MBF6462828.1 hypothetical protein [Nocardia puris]RBO96791.1 hypothetical protein DFR74_101808 [Nocardia puris]
MHTESAGWKVSNNSAGPDHGRNTTDYDPNRYDSILTAVGRSWMSGKQPHIRPGRTTTLAIETTLPHDPRTVFDFCLNGINFAATMPDPLEYFWASKLQGELGGLYVFDWWYKRVFPIRWAALVDYYDDGREFSDIQVRGMFRYFHHTHTCQPTDDGGTHYRDTIVFRTALGPWMDRIVVAHEMERVFRVRHERMSRMLRAGV